MYIAFPWLLALSVGMWLALCGADYFLFQQIVLVKREDDDPWISMRNQKLNVSHHAMRTSKYPEFQNSERSHVTYHYVTFLAGALVVIIFNNKRKIMYFTKKIIIQTYLPALRVRLKDFVIKRVNILKKTLKPFTFENFAAFIKSSTRSFAITFTMPKFRKLFRYSKLMQQDDDNNLMTNKEITDSPSFTNTERANLLCKLKIALDERKNLVKVLTGVMREASIIKVKYQMESMAKERLCKRLDEYQKAMKGIRLQHSTVYNLYLDTCQKNVMLRAVLNKLAKEKEEAEENFTKLIGAVKSYKRTDLLAFCNQCVAKPRNEVFCTDINAEVDQFLKSSLVLLQNESNDEFERNYNVRRKQSLNMLGGKDSYIVTVKDDQGVIEKLYEYNCNVADNGDTVRSFRREYSVFHDQDYVIEFNTSQSSEFPTCSRNVRSRFTTGRHFLTQSQAFQNFLRTNLHQITPSLMRSPAIKA